MLMGKFGFVLNPDKLVNFHDWLGPNEALCSYVPPFSLCKVLRPLI